MRKGICVGKKCVCKFLRRQISHILTFLKSYRILKTQKQASNIVTSWVPFSKFQQLSHLCGHSYFIQSMGSQESDMAYFISTFSSY